jgi:NAD(P)-dependent dehydrogenase (short-subunit alcohol dehydrogenase family)
MKGNMQTVLITGANRGIGLELTKSFCTSDQWQVLACCRDPQSAKALRDVADQSDGRVEVHQLDVTNIDSVSALAAKLDSRSIDVLLNNAGVMGGDRQSALDMDYQAWRETFEVNTMGPLRMVQLFLPNLRLSDRPRVLTISSQMGALSRKRGGSYAYRSSKAAVNKVMQGLAIDLAEDGIIVSLVHPGWVQTDMGGAQADITPQESAVGIFRIAENLAQSDSGRFLKWNGEEHPW